MKKILFILHVPPPVHGSSIVGKFIKENKRINSEFATSYVNLGTSNSIDEIGKGGFRKILLYTKILISILKQLIFNRPDLVYLAITAKGIAFYKDFIVVFLIKLFRVNLVLHFHNKGVSNYQHKFIDHLLYKLTFKNTSVILLSEHLYYDVKKYVEPENVYYCPNGIPNMKVFHHTPKDEQNFEVIHLLFLSNLIKSKGVFTVLEACKLLKAKGLKFDCTFIGGEGDIDKSNFNKELIRLGIEDIVKYEGKKYGEEKEQAFSKADIFVFPTFYHNECFPLVLLEAMQYSLPIISTFEGGIPSIVLDNENGYLVNKNDINSLIVNLSKLILNSTIRLEFGKKGRELYEEKYTLKIFEDNLTEILKKNLSF
ncbi:glycosyltransferase [Maribacter confluentis]|uniref:Glycosyltransferase n=1 Tax=Maribacter confluentis TaxID=1656093 RepID=A0ABT8RRZ0_9FLAO|nr:glycosyltransferase [Maribacter confluentis]MDO1513695.1 glycosyltransferase [Maribacter confluentis]